MPVTENLNPEGLNERVRNALVAVGTTSVLISQARKRAELVITNTSSAAQNITISIGQDATATYGIFLLPYSVYSPPDNVPITEQPIFAVASAGGGQVSIFER